MVLKIALKRLEVRRCALAWNEAQLHQPARRIVDEHQQRAGLATVLEPAVLAAVDLHQLAETLSPQSRLMECSALLTRQPQTLCNHPSPQRLASDPQFMLVQQHLGGQRRSEVPIPGLHQLDCILPDAGVHAPVRRVTTCLMNQLGAATRFVPGQQPVAPAAR